MSKVAEDVRRMQDERVSAMEPGDRVELALRLGWEALESLRIEKGISREAALAMLRDQRQHGRTPCSFLRERG